MTTAYQTILALFNAAGADEYFGEDVTVAQHMLQTGAAARAAGSPIPVVVASVVHDVGHLLQSDDGGALLSGTELMDGVDNKHDQLAARWLATWFDESVTAPVRLHVAAKRYLCAVDAAYYATLSDASKYTMSVQGGVMSEREVADFEALPYHRDAITLRRFDDFGKSADAAALTLADFRADIDSLDRTFNR